MTVENSPEQAPKPSFVIDDTASTPQREALAEFELVASSTEPEYVAEGIEVFDDNPRMALSVARIVNYLRRNPKGIELFEAWSKIIDTEADKAAWFDDQTETQLEQDTTHAGLVNRAKNGGGSEAINQVRRSRFANFARRLFEAASEDDGHASNAA